MPVRLDHVRPGQRDMRAWPTGLSSRVSGRRMAKGPSERDVPAGNRCAAPLTLTPSTEGATRSEAHNHARQRASARSRQPSGRAPDRGPRWGRVAPVGRPTSLGRNRGHLDRSLRRPVGADRRALRLGTDPRARSNNPARPRTPRYACIGLNAPRVKTSPGRQQQSPLNLIARHKNQDRNLTHLLHLG